MKTTLNFIKNYWYWILPIPVIIIYLLIKHFMKPSGIKPKGTAPEGFKKVAKKYGVEYAQNLERMFRKETAHFKSGQWLGTGTPGMEAVDGKNSFPWGWSSLQEWANQNGLSSNDFFIKEYTDNHTKKKRNFIGFKETGKTVQFIAWFIHNKRGGDIISWYRLPSEKTYQARKKYASEMMQITPKFV